MAGNHDSRISTLEVNKRQADFYDGKIDRGRYRIYSLWRLLRGRTEQFRRDTGIRDAVIARQRGWFGTVRGKRILDLGPGAGNHLSLELASACGEYLAVDLSSAKLACLEEKLRAARLEHARTKVMDFCEPDWREGQFDIIYANAVLHHFPDVDLLIALLLERLRPGGLVVSWDPLAISVPARLLRAAYRPFQADAAWEFPFNKETLRRFGTNFEVVGVQGILGASKWALPLYLIPGCQGLAMRAGKRLGGRDLRVATTMGPSLYGCLQIIMCLRKPLG